MKARSVARILFGVGALAIASSIGALGYGFHLEYFDADGIKLSAEVKKQEENVSRLEKEVKEHWESLGISDPYGGVDKVQAAELYLLRPDVFGQAKADSGLAYKVGSLLLERYELTQIREKKHIMDYETRTVSALSIPLVMVGMVLIFAGLVARNKAQKQALYKKEQAP